MQPPNLLPFLRRLHDLDSEERQLYRDRKAKRACPLCGNPKPEAPFCAPCYAALKKAKREATQEGVCSTCFTHPIAPAASPRYRGPLTQCKECREAEAARQAERTLRRQLDL
ncbi:hypothetical protein LCGC14_2465230 [marine sediment metagenome]|uniref:Double zinc ribbon domain-containing protein n=1 Tax=marine sediment metagenome TaxID=412755 RepID=A0A0F9DP84_9ZZZZ